MRDPWRIDAVLASLREAWILNPDLRLGQLLFNVGGGVADDAPFLYNLEDDLLTERIKTKYINPTSDDWRR